MSIVFCLVSIGHHPLHIYEAAGLSVQELDFYKDYKLQSKSDSISKLDKPGAALRIGQRLLEPALTFPYSSSASCKAGSRPPLFFA